MLRRQMSVERMHRELRVASIFGRRFNEIRFVDLSVKRAAADAKLSCCGRDIAVCRICQDLTFARIDSLN